MPRHPVLPSEYQLFEPTAADLAALDEALARPQRHLRQEVVAALQVEPLDLAGPEGAGDEGFVIVDQDR